MQLLCERNHVLSALAEAQRTQRPLFCPNAETPDEIQAVLAAAEHYASKHGLNRITIGLGITGSYPEHPQLQLLKLPHNASEQPTLIHSAHWWLDNISLYARKDWFPHVCVIPFYDHGWVPNAIDRELLSDVSFQERMGIIMFDASAFDLEENIRLTHEYVQRSAGRVVVEACPDKILSKAQLDAAGASAAQILTAPEVAAQFVRRTGVDLIVPSLGTEHRGEPGAHLRYRSDLAREIAERTGPILALHGTSSLGERLGNVATDGICKVNFYTAMAMDASRQLQATWAAAPQPLRITNASGANVFTIRRDACTRTCIRMLETLYAVH